MDFPSPYSRTMRPSAPIGAEVSTHVSPPRPPRPDIIDADYEELNIIDAEKKSINAGKVLGAAGKVAGGVATGIGAIGAAVNPRVNRAGDLSADAGIMGIKEPFIMVKRNESCYPTNDDLGKLEGFPAYTHCKLSNCKGFTVVDKVILNVSATDDEKEEIEMLLKKGVYL